MMRPMATPKEDLPLPDWGQDRLQVPGAGALAWRLVAFFGLPVVVLLFGLPAGLAPLLVLAIILVYCAAVTAWVVTQGTRALRSVGAREARPGELGRLENLVRGLSSDLGIKPPVLLVTAALGPNAMVAKGSHYSLVVTEDLVGAFSRTELEAVLAHCLVRIAGRQVVAAQAGLAMGRLGVGVGGVTGAEDDVLTASVTRYPPALASALEKCELQRGRLAPLWFAAEGPSHVPLARRIAVLNDL
jgi:hypothetical protein